MSNPSGRRILDELREERRLVVEMLDRLEADDDVGVAVLDRNGRGVGDVEGDVPRSVGVQGVGDRLGRGVDPDDLGGELPQERRAVALAARDVDDPPADAVAEREQVAVEVLVLDLVADVRRVALARELETRRPGWSNS